jgi:putative endopeptidase
VLNNTIYYTNRLFGAWITQGYDQPDVVVPYLLQGGLGMPDRDFYLEGGRMAELRTAYQAHAAKMLSLAGIADAEAKAASRFFTSSSARALVCAVKKRSA